MSPGAGALRAGRAQTRRRRIAAAGLLLAAAAVLAAVLSSDGGSRAKLRTDTAAGGPRATRKLARHATAPPSSFAVGYRVLRLRDLTRTITLPDGTREPRPLTTVLRYPAVGPVARTDAYGAPPARIDGPFPLIVFGHGFAVTPALYSRLLQSWARAGYVVAAPVFPLGNAAAPGGPDEADLTNQPADMSYVITKLLQISAVSSGQLRGLIDPRAIALSGQSDGGDTALAAAYDPPLRDRRVDAAAILSGAEIPALGPFRFPDKGPPLLAVQGTDDTINLPSETEAFFNAAPTPKYLLRLIGAQHLPPYSTQEPQLAIVERVTRTFFDAYLKHRTAARARLLALGSVAAVAEMLAEP